MGLCCTIFHWPPETFWRSTPHEIHAAIEGAEKANAPADDSTK